MRFPLLLVCAGGLLLGQDSGPVALAWKLAANGQREQAVAVLQQAIATKPADAEARLLLGSLLMEAGRGPEAVAQLTEAVKLRPHSADAQNALGEAYNALDDYQAARPHFESAIKIKPDFGVAQMNLGDALIHTGDLDLAAEHLDRAIKLLGHGDDAASARYLRAKVYMERDDSSRAQEQLQQAVAIRPAFPQAWSDLGQARKTLLDDAGALAAFERAVQLAPDDSVAQYRLGAAYLDADKPKLAVEHLEMAYRLRPEDQSTLNALQKGLRQEGRVKEADEIKAKLAEYLQKKDVANQNAVTATSLNNEGARLEKSGDLASALTKYRAAVTLAPENVPMRVNYAVALLRLGHWTDGLNELHGALERDPGNGTIREALKEAVAQAPAGTVPDWSRR